jgi:hypothetical protein
MYVCMYVCMCVCVCVCVCVCLTHVILQQKTNTILISVIQTHTHSASGSYKRSRTVEGKAQCNVHPNVFHSILVSEIITHTFICEISDFRHGAAEVFSLLGFVLRRLVVGY